jgi:hypothetical protein
MTQLLGIKRYQDMDKKHQQVWDLVNFIEAVPYPSMLPDDVRRQVYKSESAGEVQAAAAIRD